MDLPLRSRGALAVIALAITAAALPTARAAEPAACQPNILVIWRDDIGQFNVGAYNLGMMGYKTPNIDRIAREGALFTDWYGQQSCTAGRAAFMTGQSPIRTGLTKVGLPGAPEGMRPEDPTIATLLRARGYVTGQFRKNHLGDRDEMLPTAHGFDEFFGNLYHLNAEEEPEHPDYPKDPAFKKRFGPRGVIHSFADGGLGLRRPERERFRFLGREHRKRPRPELLRDEGPSGGGRHPASSVRAITSPVRPPLCPWSLPSAGFPRGPASGLMPAPRRHAARSGVRDGEPTGCRRIARRQVWWLVTACTT